MDKRRIGSLEVTIVGVGCANFGRQLDELGTTDVVRAAIDAGINFFDTADNYGQTHSEEFLGKALGRHRDEVVIATKVGQRIDDERPGGGGARYIRSAAEESLRRLGTDHVDLLQFHSPDPKTPMAETLGAFTELVDEGKAIEIGCSNFSLEQLREAATLVEAGRPGFVSATNQYSLIQRIRELDVLPECGATRTAFLPWLPLYHGLLSGKYLRGVAPPRGTRLGDAPAERQNAAFSDRNFEIVEQLTAYAASRGHTILELAFAWLFAQSAIASVIAGVTSSAQVRANASTTSWILSPEELAAIDLLVPAPAAAGP